MPVQIGAEAHSFSDPTGLLNDCHRRMEMFLRTLEAVAEVVDRPADEETRAALETALRYFSQAAPKHTADEEKSLFPRLRRLQDPEVALAFAKLEQLEQEHRWTEPLHAEVERLGSKYLSDGRLSAAEIEQFRNSIASLATMYKRHIAMEDDWLFPLAASKLSADEKSAIAEEMAKRRQVELITQIAGSPTSTL
jgi:hemerythrin-like domain-containing protein